MTTGVPTMTVGSYRTSTKELWYFVIDLPPGDDGKRRQHKRRGFPSKTAAEKAETEAQKAYGEASIGADGSVAAELTGWLSEHELDIEETTLGVDRCRRKPRSSAPLGRPRKTRCPLHRLRAVARPHRGNRRRPRWATWPSGLAVESSRPRPFLSSPLPTPDGSQNRDGGGSGAAGTTRPVPRWSLKQDVSAATSCPRSPDNFRLGEPQTWSVTTVLTATREPTDHSKGFAMPARRQPE